MLQIRNEKTKLVPFLNSVILEEIKVAIEEERALVGNNNLIKYFNQLEGRLAVVIISIKSNHLASTTFCF